MVARTVFRNVVAPGVVAFVLICTAVPLPGQGWNPQEILRSEKFVKPPADVERIITTPRVDISFSNPSPDRRWFVRLVQPNRGSIADYGKAFVNFAGLRLDTAANRVRTMTTGGGGGTGVAGPATAFMLVDPRTGATRTIAGPAGATVSAPTWSPAGTHLAFLANFRAASHVFVADVATGRSTQVTRTPVLATLVTTLDWSADGRHVVTVLVPDARGPLPTHGPNNIEDGPQVRLTEGRRLPQRVHFDLLEDPHDAAMLKYYTTGQLAVIDVRTRAVRKVGAPAMIRSVDMSPDAQYFRVTTMVEPFSYIVPQSSFGSVQELWDTTGTVVTRLSRSALSEGGGGDDDTPGSGFGGQAAAPDTGKRNLQWNPVGPGMVYLQSVFAGPANGTTPGGRQGGGAGTGRGGAPQARQPSSVRYMQWNPPYGPNDTQLLYEGSGRLTGVSYSVDGRTMFVSDSGQVIAIRTNDPSKRFSLGTGVALGGGGGRGGGGGFTRRGGGGVSMGGGGGGRGGAAVLGGTLATRPVGNRTGVIVASDNRTVFLSGTREPGDNWKQEGPRPWVDKLDIETGQRTRLFDAPADAWEQFVTALDDDHAQFLYSRESRTVITDVWLRDSRTGESRKITNNVDVAPDVTGALVKVIPVSRPRDRLTFNVEITFPKDYRAGTRLPGVIWFYPREYTGQDEYDRVQQRNNINRFPAVPTARPASSMQLWITQGYALIEPDFPIVGPTGQQNDSYLQDLRETLEAVVNAVVDSGFIDRDRIGLGGHSYGAFSTVNALTIMPIFKAGIAGDGMYNRTLTPFAFQSERRNFWEAQDMYLGMSAFLRADKMSAPLLLYHGLDDQNVGTHPISSIRMYQALQGLGKPAAMYLYPYEDHSVGTYESDLDLWARWFAWFDVYVKNAKPAPVVP